MPEIELSRGAIELAASVARKELTGGRWVTIRGVHVYIKDGKIAAGPDDMVGKKPADVGDIQAEHGAKKPAKAKAETNGDDDKPRGDKSQTDDDGQDTFSGTKRIAKNKSMFAGKLVDADGNAIGADETVTLYHVTTEENAARIARDGFKVSNKTARERTKIESKEVADALGKAVGDELDYEPGRGQGKGVYVGTDPGELSQYGDVVIAVRVKVADLSVPPERSGAYKMTPTKSLLLDDGYIARDIDAADVKIVRRSKPKLSRGAVELATRVALANCGTGAGGFKSGNTCAAGGGDGREKEFRPGDRVRFEAGEYAGKTGVVQSIVQKRYTKETTMYRVQIDGFPKPGGWNGQVTVSADSMAKHDEPAAVAEPVATKEAEPAGQLRAKAGGEYGPNGEWYKGGAYIATTTMPKATRAKLTSAAKGRRAIAPGQYEVPTPGKLPIFDALGPGTGLNVTGPTPATWSINENYLMGHQGESPEKIARRKELLDKFRAGERYVDVNDYPELARWPDLAAMSLAGMPISGEALDRMASLRGITREELEKQLGVKRASTATKPSNLSRAAVELATRVALANCGTGAGGFQPGNKCAKGGTGSNVELTEDEKTAVHDYTLSAWQTINSKLRDGETLTGDEKKKADAIDAAIAKAGTRDEPITVYRGIEVPRPPGPAILMTEADVREKVADYAAKRYPVGETVTLGSNFQSASTGTESPLDHSVSRTHPGILFEIETRSGLDVSAVSGFDDEDEFLLPRDRKYEVVGIERQREFERPDDRKVTRTVVKLREVVGG